MAFNNIWRLKSYDLLSRLTTKYLWKYPPAEYVAFYSKFMNQSKNHLEIGTASMYYCVKSDIEDRLNMKVTLLDLEALPLQYGKDQMVANGFHQSLIKTVQCDATNISQDAIEPQTFETIGMSHVLQCVPGPMTEKFPSVLEGLSPYMDEHTQLFGCCIVNMDPDGYNSAQEQFMRLYQKRNIWLNQHDTKESVKQVLEQYFDTSDVKDIGYGFTSFDATHFKHTFNAF
eukprot:30621_1